MVCGGIVRVLAAHAPRKRVGEEDCDERDDLHWESCR